MKNSIHSPFLFLILAVIAIGLFLHSHFFEKRNVYTYPQNTLPLRIDTIRNIKIKKRHIETPDSVRAIYLSSWTAGNKKIREKLIKFIENSRINAVVIDIKDYSGEISFPIDHPLIKEYGTAGNRIEDIAELIQELHDRGIYIIGRITTFQDPLLAEKKPEYAFRRKDNGRVWKDRHGLAFIDPQKEEAWTYYTTLAEESYHLGFDEINFDYIRYPSDGNIANLNYNLKGNTKLSAMKKFYKFLDDNLRKKNIPISADLFGFVASLDKGIPVIGQKLVDVLPYFDAVALMVYPSHYPKTYLGFSNAAEHPYEVVVHEMTLAKEKEDSLHLDGKKLRTWIQDFNMGASYGFHKIQEQIKASYQSGVFSYMVWDPRNRYTKSAYTTNLLKKYEEKKQQ